MIAYAYRERGAIGDATHYSLKLVESDHYEILAMVELFIHRGHVCLLWPNGGILVNPIEVINEVRPRSN